MVLNGKKKPSKRIISILSKLGVNLKTVNFQTEKQILSHARLPIPTPPIQEGIIFGLASSVNRMLRPAEQIFLFNARILSVS